VRVSFTFVASALCVAVAARLAWSDPKVLPPFLVIVLVTLIPTFFARRRVRRILMSGDVKEVLGTWRGSLERVMYPETMAPLMMATAYASCGWIDAARAALQRAVKGPAWDAAIEQRLFVETLLDTFEGDRISALEKAHSLESLPLPRTAGRFTRARILRLRKGMAALARAFAHQASAADSAALRKASKSSPLIFWATRYASAIIAVDRGDTARAEELIAGAPEWPNESAFRTFDQELRSRTRS
jgi:hypothetical protein